MSTALQIKVVTLLAYVALSTLVVLLLSEDGIGGHTAQTPFPHAIYR